MKYVVTLNGKQYEVEVEKVGGQTTRTLGRQPVERGVRRENTVVKETVKEEKVETMKKVENTSGAANILSPMPGVILDIKVKVGDSVKYGQTLAILEAMKMENDIPATQDGEVAEIKVKKGDTVETDSVIIVLK